MKQAEQPTRYTRPAMALPTQGAGLYGEIRVLPVNPAASERFYEPKAFADPEPSGDQDRLSRS